MIVQLERLCYKDKKSLIKIYQSRMFFHSEKIKSFIFLTQIIFTNQAQ